MSLIKKWRQNAALRVSLIYLLVAGIWILSSDWLLQLLIPGGEALSRLQTFKGSAFVLATTIMLYALVRSVRPQREGGQTAGKIASRWVPLLIFLLIFSSIAVTGWSVFASLRNSKTQEIHNSLASVTELKIAQISRWLDERRGDAQVVSENSALAIEIAALIRDKTISQQRQQSKLESHLDSYIRHYHYHSITLFDIQGEQLMHIGAPYTEPGEHRDDVLATVQARQPRLIDFHLHGSAHGNEPAMGMMAPVLVDDVPVAVVYFAMDPKKFLFPLIESWPVATQTAETALVRREGDRVRFLSRTRGIDAEPLSLSRPLDSPKLAAARLIRGESGILERSLDYTNASVLAYGKPVPGTPWYLVAKIHEEEVYAPVRRLAGITGLLSVVLMIISASAIWLWWQREQNRHQAERTAAELAQQQLSLHYDYLSRHANDIIIITDESGRFTEINDRALQVFGYSRVELLGQVLGVLRTDQPAHYLLSAQADDDPTGLIFEAEHKRRDGTTFPAEVSARIINENGHQYCHMVIRDISERKAAEHALVESAQKFRRLLDFLPVAVGYVDADGRISYLNRRHSELFGYALEEIADIEDWKQRAYPDPDYRRSASEQWDADVARALEANSDIEPREYEITCKDGKIRTVEISGITFENGLLVTFIDHTARKQDEIRIHRLTRFYATLSRINETIVTLGADDTDEVELEQRLFDRICQIAVNEGGMKMVWIGRVNPVNALIEPVAQHGDGTHYLDEIMISSRADIPEGRGPTGTALRENRAFFVQDFARNPLTQRWHHHAQKYHWGASAAVPIQRGGKPYAVLTLYHGQRNAFDQDVERLLQEIAGDVSFALNSLDARAERKLIQQKLETANMVVVNSRAILWRWAAREGWPVEYVSENISQYGYLAEDFLSGRVAYISLIHPDDLARVSAEVARQSAAGAIRYNQEYRIIDKRGQVRWISDDTVVLRDETGSIIHYQGVTTDVTERVEAERALLAQEQQFRAYFERSMVGMATTSVEKGWIEVNPALCKLLGYPREELLTKTWAELTHPDDLEGDLSQFNRLLSDELDEYTLDKRFVRSDGQIIYSHIAVRALRRADRSIEYFVALVEDISAAKQAEAKVAETMQKLELDAEVFRHSREGIIISDSDNRIISVNPAFCGISGYTEAEVIGQNPGLLKSGRQDEDFYREMWRAIHQDGHWHGEVWNRRKNGEIYPERLSISAVRDSDGKITHHIGILADISEYKAAQEKIQHMAHFDSLTGLPNRTLLRDRAYIALAAAQRGKHQLALCFLDLDHFKNINDSLGHQLGDALLEQVGKRLSNVLREEDTVARIGGDEFVLLLPDSDTAGVAHVAEKLLQEIAVPYHIDNYEFSITLSIGIAMYPENGDDFDTLSRCADSALYRAKQGGRNNFCFFTAEMHQRAQRVLQMETALHRALERNQLSLNYQPQVDAHSGRLIGCEALLRWKHPEFGQVSPAEFVPIAEDSGLILHIGAWVIREAARQVKAWEQEGLPLLPVAVNLSAAQFRQPHLAETVINVLAEAELSADYLELELTESITMNDPMVVIGIMDELHGKGFKLSIDDFGTGYSSLSYLKRFNIDKLKIDQSFVRDLATDPEDAAIVTAIINLAHNLGLNTIAEGVETVEQLQFLREHGCDQIQGYYFSRPLPAEQFAELLREEMKNPRPS